MSLQRPTASLRYRLICFVLSFSSIPVVLGCSDDADCQLNGICDGGRCICDAAWTSDDCSKLNLKPPKLIQAAYPPPDLLSNTTSWGASVLQDGDTYHMFAAEMSNGCGMQTWSTNSQIVHATATHPAGPYQRQSVINPPFSHNPTVSRAPDGTWVLYHIGCGDGKTRQCTDCANGISGSGCPSPPETVSCTPGTTPGTTPMTANVLFAQAPEGPWQAMNAQLENGGSPPRMGKYGIDNPSAYFFPNGSVLLLGRCDASSVGRIVADSWRGPYHLGSEVGNAAAIGGVEDPFLYRDKRGHFHALFHGGHQGGGYKASGAHAFSSNGVHWTFSLHASYTTDVCTTDGKCHSYNRRERPHLLFGSDGQPAYLFTSLSNWVIGGKDSAFTFAQAIHTASEMEETHDISYI